MKLCPHCFSKAKFKRQYVFMAKGWVIQCSKCPVRTDFHEGKENALSQWEKRQIGDKIMKKRKSRISIEYAPFRRRIK